MKRFMKSSLAVVLCLIMLVGIMPMGAFAEEDQGKITAKTDDLNVSGNDGFGNVLTKAVGESEDENPDFAITDFYIVESNIAYVKFQNTEDCKITIALYDEETGQMLASGITNVKANEYEANVYIDIDEMPDYYIMKAFMLDDNNAPLGEPQLNIESSKTFEEFDKKTVDDFSDDVVINFDDKKDDNFAVLVDNSKEMEYDGVHNILTSYSESEGKYEFENIDSNITSLKKGDVFSFSVEKTVYLLKVNSVSVTGTKAVVYEEMDLPIESYFQYIDIDTNSYESEDGIEYNTDETCDELEIVGYETWDEGNDYGLTTQKEIINIDEPSIALSTPLPVFQQKDKEGKGYLAGDDDSAFSIQGKFEAKLSAKASIKCYFDATWTWKWDFWNSLQKYFYFQAKIDVTLKGEVSLTVNLQGEFTLCNPHWVVYGIVIEGPVKIHIEGSLTFSASIEVKSTLGFYYDDDSGFKNLSSFLTPNFYPKGEITVDVSLSVKFTPEISFVKVVGLKLKCEFGVSISSTLIEISTEELLNVSSVSDIHLCKFGECFEGTISLFLKVTIGGEIFGKDFAEKEIKPKVTWQVASFYLHTNPFEIKINWSSKGGAKCPNYVYRCDFTVLNNDDSPISNLQVYSNGPDLGGKYKYNVTNATDEDGKVSFFYAKGKYTPEFYLNGAKIDVSKIRTKLFGSETSGCSVQMIDTTKSVTVKIDTDFTEGGGNGHNGGGGSTDWFMRNARFHALGGKFSDGSETKTIEIRSGNSITPPADPTKDNYFFDGWFYYDDSVKKDMPDKMPNEDTTFYAKWATTPPSSSDGTGSDDKFSNIGTQGGIIQFGSYPQTDVTSSMGTTLNSEANGWKSYKYYEGTGSSDGTMYESDYMYYCDVTYGNNKYRGVIFNTYRPYYTENASTTSCGTYQDDNGYTVGNTYWFKYEPIKWRVLDPATGLVLSDAILDSQAYNNYILYESNVADPYYSYTYWGDSAKTYYANNYAKSSIRQWLNNDFYNTAFSTSQQNIIQSTKLDNSAYSTSRSAYDSVSTTDKIFLLSYAEVQKTAYGFTNSTGSTDTRTAKGSDYAKCQGLYVNSSNGNSYWRLRSAGDHSRSSCSVYIDGYVFSYCDTYDTHLGVRAALKLNLKSLTTQSKVGTQAEKEGTVNGYKYNCSACEAGGEYILLNVTSYGNNFTLTTQNLEYIDQLTADENGKIEGSFIPRNAYSNSTTLLIGDFGNGIEAKKLTVTENSDIPDIEIKNYQSSISVDYKSTLTFHTDIDAPAGYKIVWSNGQEGNTCTLSNVTEKEYKVSAKLVKISDGSTVKGSKVETVSVNTGFFAKLVAFFRGLFKSLPAYIDNKKQ